MDSNQSVVAVIPKSADERFLFDASRSLDILDSLGICDCGLSKLEPPYRIERTNFTQHHIVIFTFTGSGVLELESGSTLLEPGSMTILPANCDHSYQARRHWKILWFHLKCGPEFDSLVGREARVAASRYGDRLQALAEDFWTEVHTAEQMHALATSHIAALFDILLKRELHAELTPFEAGQLRRLEAMWRTVNHELNKDWSITELCRIGGFSRTRLHEACKRWFGHSANDYLTQLRLQKAAHYLLASDWTLQDIAERVGYETAFAFSRAFKRVMQISPDTYRRSLRAESNEASQ